jgi:hypothetical protein
MFFSKQLFSRIFCVANYGVMLMSTLVLFSTAAVAQISQPHRYERKQKNSYEPFNVISLQEEGIALFREQDKYKGQNKLWELIILDTALAEKKTMELEVKERYKLIGYEVVPENIFFLYRTGETTKNSFELIQVSTSAEEKSRQEIKPDFDFRPTHFSKVGKNFVFGGYVNNDPAIFSYNIETRLIKVIPGFFQKDAELVDLRANVNGTFNTVMIDRGVRDGRKLFFKTFTEEGELLLEDIVPIDENITLQTGLSSTLEREDLVLLGNWGEKSSKQSKGFFSLTIDPFGDQKIQYYDFGKLTHYLDYINPKRAEKLKTASKEDATAGEIPTYTNYVMPYRIAESAEAYYLLAEVYTPTSTTSPYYSSPYYNPYYYSPSFGYGPTSYYRPRGYQPAPYSTTLRDSDIKTHESVVIAFDGTGKMLWDFSMKLEDIELPSVEQATDFHVGNGKAYLIYKAEDSMLKVKMIRTADGTSEDFSEKVKTLESTDVIRDERKSEGSVRFWYDNAFYVWGYQTLKNETHSDRVRDVFYINKISTH